MSINHRNKMEYLYISVGNKQKRIMILLKKQLILIHIIYHRKQLILNNVLNEDILFVDLDVNRILIMMNRF